MKAARLFSIASLAAAILLVLSTSSVFAQEGPSEESMRAALEDLSAIYGSPVVRIDQASAICNQEQFMVECANIGKKHGLFPEEREQQVNSILLRLKGRVVDELKLCGDTECLINVATRIARELSAANPTLAREVDLTPQDVQDKRSIIEVSKSVGVDIEECRTMDPDTASVELLRACAKLAKHERIQQYIPEEHREQVEKTEKTAELKEALANGEIACGDGTLEGCGTFCLNQTAVQREEGPSAIPLICRQIAEQFFGPEGVQELERTYSNVRQTYEGIREIYRERADNPENVLPIERAHPLPGVTCPTVENTPCPPGLYRQGSVNEFGCYVRGACIPFNTETHPEWMDRDKNVICPAMPTVDSCPAGEDKVVTYSSPECGTYYMCRPRPEDRTTKFPYKFASGRVVVSFEEGRIYCYESGPNGATLRGDKGECLRSLGINVPDIPPEKHCAQYGDGWHTMDSSGNCFNESMTEYRSPGGLLRSCSTAPAYGCMENPYPEPPGGQREQVWNSLGLRSWIRADASEARIADLKAACANAPSGTNVWLPGAGTFESKDFGMPDPDKCRKATSCTSSQYFDGTECKEQSQTICPAGHQWNGTMCTGGDPGRDMQRCFYEDATKNGAYIGYTVWCESDYNNCHEGSASGPSISLSGVSLGAPSQCESGWDEGGSSQCSDGKDNDSDGKIDYPADTGCYDKSDNEESYPKDIEPQCPLGQYWNGSTCRSESDTVSGTCSSDIKVLLGSGCHSMGTAWFNGAMTSYVLPGSGFVKTCASEKISGCSGTHTSVTCPPNQFWSGSSCASSEGTICASNEYWDSGKGMCTSSQRECASAGGTWDSSVNYCRMPNAPTPTPSPGPTTTGTAQCSDGKDNDSDGKIDYPADTGCYGASDWSEAYESTTGNQKTQVWNSYGLQSMIRADADPARIATLKESCALVKSSASIWMPGAGTYSSTDFGMPDPGKCAKAATCASDQYFDGSSCTSTSGGGSGGGGSGSMQRCFYTNATRNGSPMGYSVWCESDYYNCHEGSQSGASISLSGVSLGAPSQCEGGWSSTSNTTIGSECRSQTSQSTCSAVSGCYWYTGYSGSYCDSSGSAASTGSGGGCGMYTSESSCNAMSACLWQSNACSYKSGSTGGSSGSWSSCPSNQYWDTVTNSCRGNESACAEAGGSWSSSQNYCVMPGTSSGSSGSSTSCPSGQYWSGSACVSSGSSGASSCGSGLYWDGSACVSSQTTTDYSQMQSSCASAGGTWDSSSNYCRMPTASAAGLLAYLCPPNHAWNGSHCTFVEQKSLGSFVASVIQAFTALFGR
ncbi:hypothetical protein A3A39_00300 [Candidatus Kaiserbacteria bacterium RIFCSPLOWO2_01_FULL_54_13]|uniref:Ig-like domain-containing protein n=1 Tax=Candidatus Kaiserbacteria bacterium RIFCSPLOWO2_01_FULL_54_13 TaxID=1798512 RepID=A0A1F6F3R6_9BACT|nr:MAG: hypothetical protein A3A39_00300 [Candidatus Kaiserbacteria bacterium RIFCSPLOWO2_01_FULL_54_13]